MCETRWCERHEAVFLFKETLEPILASLEEIKEWPGELSQKATSLLNSISNLNFIITLYVLSKFLGITYTLSKQLQSVHLDIVSAINLVKDIIQLLEKDRQNADTEFKTIFTQAKNVCDSLGIEITIPRTTKFQKHRCNVPTSDPESYYRISVFIPLIDDLVFSLTDRFLSHETTIISLKYILPESAMYFISILKKASSFIKTTFQTLTRIH